MSEELFLAIQQGDKIAFEHFYKDYYPRINHFILKFVRDKTDAEDIAANCFIKIWERLARAKNAGHLKNLLFIIAKNLCIDHLRSSMKGKHEGIDALLEMIGDSSYLEGSQVEGDLLVKMRHYMDKLGDNSKKVLRLRYLDELDYAEIAAQMGMTIKNVYLLRNRAFAYLRSKLGTPALIPLLLTLYFSLHDDSHHIASFLGQTENIFDRG